MFGSSAALGCSAASPPPVVEPPAIEAPTAEVTLPTFEELQGCQASADRVAFAASGSVVALARTGIESDVIVVDWRAGTSRHVYHDELRVVRRYPIGDIPQKPDARFAYDWSGITDMALSPDGSMLAIAASESQQFQIGHWAARLVIDTGTLRPLYEHRYRQTAGAGGSTGGPAFSPNGHLLAFGATLLRTDDFSFDAVDEIGGELRFSASGRWIVGWRYFGVWSLDLEGGGKFIHSLETQNSVPSVWWDEGEHDVAILDDGTIAVRSFGTAELTWFGIDTSVDTVGLTKVPTALAATSNQVVIGYEDGSVEWRTRDSTSAWLPGKGRAVKALRPSLDPAVAIFDSTGLALRRHDGQELRFEVCDAFTSEVGTTSDVRALWVAADGRVCREEVGDLDRLVAEFSAERAECQSAAASTYSSKSASAKL